MFHFISLPSEVIYFSVAMFIVMLFSMVTQLKSIYPELGEQSCLQHFRVFLASVLYSATKPTLFLQEIPQITLWSCFPLSWKVSFHFGQHWSMRNDLYFPLLLSWTWFGTLAAFTVLSEPACLLLWGFAKLLVLLKKLWQRENKGEDAFHLQRVKSWQHLCWHNRCAIGVNRELVLSPSIWLT